MLRTMIDKIFRDYDLEFVPEPVRYIIVMMFFLVPVLCCMNHDAQIYDNYAEASDSKEAGKKKKDLKSGDGKKKKKQ